uniref:SH3 domain-containing protein n=1 Tax=Ascaris lumbricoides TaxID=6252 RepID=A0A0M3I411_ASCLU
MAEQQRRLIDANRREIEEREARPPRVENAAARLAALRNEVLLEEREMARLNAIQREAREACTQRVAAEKQLYDLQNSFSSQEEQLRNAASRIDSLKTQLDLLYRRRLSAMNAARAQQKRLNAQNAQNRSLKNDEASRPNNSNDSGVSRPRASVEPFQIARPTVVVTKEEKRRIDSTVVPPAPPLPPSQIVRNILSPSKDLTDRVVFRKSISDEQIRREESPSPPKDPYPSPMCSLERATLLVQKSEANITSSVPVASVTDVISANARASPIPPPVNTPSSVITTTSIGNVAQQSKRGTNMHQLWNEAKILDEEAALAVSVIERSPPRGEDSGRVAMADQISIRPDTLRAAKRRSWAQQETSLDEAEYIRKILCEQQKKGRTHLNLDSHLENLLSHSSIPEVIEEKSEPADPIKTCAEVNEELPSTSIDDGTKEESPLAEPKVDIESPVEETLPEKQSSPEANSPSDSLEPFFSEIIYDSMKLIKPPPEKVVDWNFFQGILRPSGVKKPRRHIVFDPLALLLDAALEGEMDLVRASAAKTCAEVNEELPSTSIDDGTKEESPLAEPKVDIESPVEETLPEKQSSPEANSPSDSLEPFFSEIIYDSMKLIKPPPEKGILRPSGVKKPRRHIVFDPLALLLDAALEGEMDLVRASAAQMPDLSASNDEGITALHNAICAGHYEIVRFLVESLANVNAQDSDGWTPLHCAASCNNLPMVKLLVESGACIFAQTLSDLETPIEKCEEDEDGYEGCQLYLHAAHINAGVVNDAKDSDGWTPLHCAASCNNLPMVKLLVESGACIFAQTLSDLETPIEKCEEDEDGYEGCQLYLHAAHINAGVVNDAKMYAAYSYEKVRDDELTFEKGECLKVIERDGDERAWWLCERFAVGDEPLQRGLVPRNYLALYPSLLDRPNDFITFELPIRCVISRDEDNANARFDDKNGNNNMLKADILEKVLIDEQPPALSVP